MHSRSLHLVTWAVDGIKFRLGYYKLPLSSPTVVCPLSPDFCYNIVSNSPMILSPRASPRSRSSIDMFREFVDTDNSDHFNNEYVPRPLHPPWGLPPVNRRTYLMRYHTSKGPSLSDRPYSYTVQKLLPHIQCHHPIFRFTTPRAHYGLIHPTIDFVLWFPEAILCSKSGESEICSRVVAVGDHIVPWVGVGGDQG